MAQTSAVDLTRRVQERSQHLSRLSVWADMISPLYLPCLADAGNTTLPLPPKMSTSIPKQSPSSKEVFTASICLQKSYWDAVGPGQPILRSPDKEMQAPS